MLGSELLAQRLDEAPTTRKIADALKVTQEAVRQWARGIAVPRKEHKEALSVLLGIPVSSWVDKRGGGQATEQGATGTEG